MRSSKGGRGRAAAPKAAPTTVCYCDGRRELGTIEIVCSQCCKWFHGRCLKEFGDLKTNGIPFMVCYSFTCKQCRPISEDWKAKKADLVQMCVTAFAIMSADRLKEEGKLSADIIPEDYTYLSLKRTVIPYMDENWMMLTSLKKRPQWHLSLGSQLLKERNVFVQHETDDDLFALAEKNLALLGPLHEGVKQIGKRTAEREVRERAPIELPPMEGPKTRGASKRRHAETAPAPGKKQKITSDYTSTTIPSGAQVDVPITKDNYRYMLTEVDPNLPEDNTWNESTTYVIPNWRYRIQLPTTVACSPSDRAYQLVPNGNTTTGCEGYAMARATHGVSKGTWYFEVNFDEQPDDSQIRIGWSQTHAPLQACVGYNKFSYGWRSKSGTKFHDARGQKYHPGGFKQGDTLGCLIHIPVDPMTKVPSGQPSEVYLPNSYKNINLISYKNNYFFEVHEEAAEALKLLKPVPGSYIEFFHNGKSCGRAYENIYGGMYFPSVSIFHKARVSWNLGPKYKWLPRGAVGIHVRAEEMQHEQSLSDLLYLVSKDDIDVSEFAPKPPKKKSVDDVPPPKQENTEET